MLELLLGETQGGHGALLAPLTSGVSFRSGKGATLACMRIFEAYALGDC